MKSVHFIQKNFEASYTKLKRGVSGVVEFARSNQAQHPLSINSFLHHTRLQANTPFRNAEVYIEQLVQDYETTIKTSKEDLLICESEGLKATILLASINTLLHNNVFILQHCL
jgi:DNA-binding ferritin-like protein